jgi:hypothetical protein
MDALLTILRQKAILLSADGNHITAQQVIEEAEQTCNALLDWESLFSMLQSKSVFETFASRPSQGGIIHLSRRPRFSHLGSRSKASGEQT